MKVPFVSFESSNKIIREEILVSFQAFFDKAWYILGENVTRFEKEYAEFNQVEHCVGISNGLDALHIALRALNIGVGDEVIIPSHTFIATALAVSYTGATPVFVEPDVHTYNINTALIEAAITDKTKAIIPVHLYGQACEMESIMTLAKKNKLFVVEDNAQAQGASYKNKLTGSWGDINATSFYPGKNLGALGDAGAVTTDSASFAEQASTLRNYGSQKKYHNEVVGYNMRLDECQAGFLSVKLKYLDEWLKQRHQIASTYIEMLEDVNDVILPATAADATHVYHLFVIRAKRRDELQKHLAKQGIGTLIHYPIPIHLQEAYKNLRFKKGDFPIAEEISETCLSLPMWPGMKDDEIDIVVEGIKSFFK